MGIHMEKRKGVKNMRIETLTTKELNILRHTGWAFTNLLQQINGEIVTRLKNDDMFLETYMKVVEMCLAITKELEKRGEE